MVRDAVLAREEAGSTRPGRKLIQVQVSKKCSQKLAEILTEKKAVVLNVITAAGDKQLLRTKYIEENCSRIDN